VSLTEPTDSSAASSQRLPFDFTTKIGWAVFEKSRVYNGLREILQAQSRHLPVSIQASICIFLETSHRHIVTFPLHLRRALPAHVHARSPVQSPLSHSRRGTPTPVQRYSAP